MTKIEQTIKQMVDALDTVEWHGGGSCWIVDDKKIEQAVQAGRALLEELKGKEPVAWHVYFGNDDEPNYVVIGKKPNEPNAVVRPLVFGDATQAKQEPVERNIILEILT